LWTEPCRLTKKGIKKPGIFFDSSFVEDYLTPLPAPTRLVENPKQNNLGIEDSEIYIAFDLLLSGSHVVIIANLCTQGTCGTSCMKSCSEIDNVMATIRPCLTRDGTVRLVSATGQVTHAVQRHETAESSTVFDGLVFTISDGSAA
jgi:hypothetical protein